MSDLERARWRIIARAWFIGLAVWFIGFTVLEVFGHDPALMYAVYVAIAVAAGAGLLLWQRRKRTAAVRDELRQVSKTKWTKEG